MDNLSSPWYRVVHFQGTFYDRVRILVQISTIFYILQIYGFGFQKFLRMYGWYLYDLNGHLASWKLKCPNPLGVLRKFDIFCTLARGWRILSCSSKTLLIF